MSPKNLQMEQNSNSLHSSATENSENKHSDKVNKKTSNQNKSTSNDPTVMMNNDPLNNQSIIDEEFLFNNTEQMNSTTTNPFLNVNTDNTIIDENNDVQNSNDTHHSHVSCGSSQSLFSKILTPRDDEQERKKLIQSIKEFITENSAELKSAFKNDIQQLRDSNQKDYNGVIASTQLTITRKIEENKKETGDRINQLKKSLTETMKKEDLTN